MKILPFLCIILFSVVNQPVSAQNQWQIRFSENLKRASNYLKRIVATMPAEAYDYRPNQESMTFREQLIHIVNNFAFLQTYISGKPHAHLKQLAQQMETATGSDLEKNLASAFEALDSLMLNLTDSDLEQEVDFFDPDAVMTKKDVLYLIRDHLAHHRGQLVLYLRMNGIQPPKYVGW